MIISINQNEPLKTTMINKILRQIANEQKMNSLASNFRSKRFTLFKQLIKNIEKKR